MLYRPLNMQPNLEAIDNTTENSFSCLVSAEGGTEVIKYDLLINNLKDEEVYRVENVAISLFDGEELLAPVPANTVVSGLDYYWKIVLYEEFARQTVTQGTIQPVEELIEEDIIPVEEELDFVNVFLRKQHYNILPKMELKIGNTQVEIAKYNPTTGVCKVAHFSPLPLEGSQYRVLTNFVVSEESYFQAKDKPVLTIDNFPTPLTAQAHVFSATYSQAQDIGWKYHIWNLYDDGGLLLESSGEVGTGELAYEFDGLLSGNSYKVELAVVNMDTVEISTFVEFDVLYNEPQIDNVPTTKYLEKERAMKTSWAQPMINLGVVEGEGAHPQYTYIQNAPYIGGSSINIKEGNRFEIVPATSSENIPIPFEHTTFLHMTFPKFFSGDIYREEALPVELVSVSDIEPTTCIAGDMYYNTITELIYTAVDTNNWGVNGEQGDISCIYQSSSTLYIWRENKLVLTEYEIPFYRIWYFGYSFYYQISNLDTQISGTVSLNETAVDASVESVWLLQELDETFPDFYSWKDDAVWDDSLAWSEKLTDIINDSWWKFYLFPTYLQVEGNIIEHTSCFDEPNREMYYDTRLYKNTKLINTNVLYI